MDRLGNAAFQESSRGVVVALETILPKLEEVLAEENKILESQVITDHEPYIMKKNHLLRELMAVQRMDRFNTIPPEMKKRLGGVRSLVETNHRLLGAQVAAMTEITNMLTAVALAEEADGTYSRRQ
jgi:predicted RecB family endonuclease